MPNDARCNAIEVRLDQLREEIERRAESRDKAQSELWDGVSEAEAQLRAITSRLAAVEAAARPVGTLQLWGPSIATLALVGSLAYLVMTLSIDPLKRKGEELLTEIRHVQADVTGAVKVINDRQDDVRQRLSRIEGGQPYLNGWIKDVDQTGSRKWVGKECRQ